MGRLVPVTRNSPGAAAGLAVLPLAFLIGVPWSEAVVASSFIGQKLVVNEFVALPELRSLPEG